MKASAEGMRPLSPRDAYRLWAPRYHEETAVSALEREAVNRVTPPLTGRTLLDAGCGTGRRLWETTGARHAVGVDLVPDMIRAGVRAGAEGGLDDVPGVAASCAAADLRALPLRAAFFDVVWCRLVLGHLPDAAPAYRELGRVAAPRGAVLIVTDFHPAAAAAGHTRSFRDEAGRVRSIEHHVHALERHIDLATQLGWRLREHVDLCVGPAIRTFYEAAGALDRYESQLGLPLVLLLVFER